MSVLYCEDRPADVDEAEGQEGDDREDERELDERLAALTRRRGDRGTATTSAHGVTVIVDVHGTDVARGRLWPLIL